MSKKIVLRTAAAGAVPDVLVKELNKDLFPYNRTGNIIDFIEQTTVVTDDKNLTVVDIEMNKDKLFKVKTVNKNKSGIISRTTYAGWSSNICGCAVVSVVEYDETQSMLITEYDGAESLTPLVCIDENLNLWK